MTFDSHRIYQDAALIRDLERLGAVYIDPPKRETGFAPPPQKKSPDKGPSAPPEILP